MIEPNLNEYLEYEKRKKAENNKFALPALLVSLLGIAAHLLPILLGSRSFIFVYVACAVGVILPVVGLVLAIKAIKSDRAAIAGIAIALCLLSLFFVGFNILFGLNRFGSAGMDAFRRIIP